MSHTQLIKDTLNILDLNIYFEENCLTKEKYKGQICLIYKRNSSVQARRVFPLSLCRPL
jgi:transposase